MKFDPELVARVAMALFFLSIVSFGILFTLGYIGNPVKL